MAVHADPEILDVENLRLRGSLEAVRLLRRQCGDKQIPVCLIMDFLSVGSWHRRQPERILSAEQMLSTTLYVLTVHSRMFNELEGFESEEAVIERFPSLDLWADSAAEQAPWRVYEVHPMVLRP